MFEKLYRIYKKKTKAVYYKIRTWSFDWFINPQQNWIKILCNVSEKNIPHTDKDEFLSTLRNVAYSTTIEEYELAEESLRSCHWFKHPVKNYIEHKWLSVKEVSRIIFENTI